MIRLKKVYIQVNTLFDLNYCISQKSRVSSKVLLSLSVLFGLFFKNFKFCDSLKKPFFQIYTTLLFAFCEKFYIFGIRIKKAQWHYLL
ncbi:hypothetical protein BpHYR1_048944 [Brachionus plicatilis]|uniref:Uncharacterized protein n=1 Tax=Brachionus plicatilis TaxID=10195 RepID=A0A3M7QVY4_BRAPC|nr:hypothetical protein BpHYR1_048944 [Brachionus plicatilis]